MDTLLSLDLSLLSLFCTHSDFGAVSKCHVQIEAAPLPQIVEKERKISEK